MNYAVLLKDNMHHQSAHYYYKVCKTNHHLTAVAGNTDSDSSTKSVEILIDTETSEKHFSN